MHAVTVDAMDTYFPLPAGRNTTWHGMWNALIDQSGSRLVSLGSRRFVSSIRNHNRIFSVTSGIASVNATSYPGVPCPTNSTAACVRRDNMQELLGDGFQKRLE